MSECGFDRAAFHGSVDALNEAVATAKKNRNGRWFPPTGAEYELLVQDITAFPPSPGDDGEEKPGRLAFRFAIQNEAFDENGKSLKGNTFFISSLLIPQMAWYYTGLLLGVFGDKEMPTDLLDAIEQACAFSNNVVVIGSLIAAKKTREDGTPYDPTLRIKDTIHLV